MVSGRAINQSHVSEHTKVIGLFLLRRTISGVHTMLRVKGGDGLFARGGHPQRDRSVAQVRQ